MAGFRWGEGFSILKQEAGIVAVNFSRICDKLIIHARDQSVSNACCFNIYALMPVSGH